MILLLNVKFCCFRIWDVVRLHRPCEGEMQRSMFGNLYRIYIVLMIIVLCPHFCNIGKLFRKFEIYIEYLNNILFLLASFYIYSEHRLFLDIAYPLDYICSSSYCSLIIKTQPNSINFN